MPRIRAGSAFLAWAGALTFVLGGCRDDSQSPLSRPEPPRPEDAPEGSMLAPLDLVYICGNRFLATNSTAHAAQVTYRVVGTGETGTLTLPGGPAEDPGYSETELETSERGIVELYHDDERMSRRRNEGLSCGAPAISSSVAALGDPSEGGEWSAPFPWPIVAVHLSLLPDGRVLSFGSAGTPELWDPTTGTFTSVPSPSREFCSGQSLLSDGRLLVVGGHISNDHGLPDVNWFDYRTQSWTTSAPMARGRWYPTATTLSTGEVVILAGKDQAAVAVTQPEVWSSGGLRVLTGASLTLPYYPRTFLAPNGRIFYAGEQQATRYLSTTGSGSWTTVGPRRYGNRSYGAAVMYEPGKIMYVGGGWTTNTAEIIDLNAGAPAWQWTGSMSAPRRHLNATLLPTGEVLVTGGTSGTAFNDVSLAVHSAEVWNPTTGIWTTLASNTIGRTYHATSILLPDGRVLHTGSGEGSNMPSERNAELFSPPYLFKGPRPSITGAPTEVGYGATFSVSTPEADSIAQVSLIRLGVTTHAFDMNQRFQRLSFTDAGDGTLTVTAPASRNDAPPGHYMLFILDGNGVPSVAAIVKVGEDLAPPPNVPPTASFSASCSRLACTFTDHSTDPDGTVAAWSWVFEDGSTSNLRNPSRTYGATGNYPVSLTVTDNVGATQQRSATVAVSSAITLNNLTGTSDATKQYVTLTWRGATGTTVDVYRNGKFLINTPNDGRHTTVRTFTGPATYVYKICQAGSTVCSNEASITFK
jgi:PKD repeat protein